MLILQNSLTSKSTASAATLDMRSHLSYRQHPAVLSQPDKVFVFIAQALEAETLQGQIATRVIQAAKLLLGITGRDPAQLMSQLSPETQQTVRAYFS
jgi:importin-5